MAEHSHESPPSGGGYGRWVFWGFIFIALFFMVTEHRAHVFQYLPFLLLAACPLLHLFHGHGGHGQRHERGGPGAGSEDAKKSEPPSPQDDRH